LGVSWALLFPGSAILLISLGLLIAVYSQFD